ncbi:MAG TPA: hypothetical protein VGF96_09025 [Terracidiphilus sp.]|jgi:hypothetical protein
MPYRSDFYCAENLIGYTGKLDDFPTVYFFKPSTGEFGHITQKHDVTNNEGREVVMISDGGYRAVNEDVKDATGKVIGRALREYSGDRLIHPSRNEFIPKAPGNEGVLLQAILRFVDEKPLAIWRDLGDGNPSPGIELLARGAPKDKLGRRGAISSGSTIRIP